MTTLTISEDNVNATIDEDDITLTLTEELVTLTIQDGIGEHTHEGFTKTAGENLGGHRIVWIDTDDKAYYADQTLATADRAIGVTTGAASLNTSVTIVTDGELVEPSWNWVVGPVFLSTSGQLTQIPPTTGHLVQVGVATAPTKMIVRIESAILR